MSADSIYAAIRPMFPSLGMCDAVAREAAERALRAVAGHETAAGGDARDAAYDAGWINAAKWADRVDLISDIGSAAYLRDKRAAIANTKGTK